MALPDDALVVLRNAAGDAAALSLHGGQLLSWVPAGEDEQVYCSPLCAPAAGKALRGGAPICFPQFSDRGPLPKHGFARTSRWELVTPPAPQAAVAEARLQLDSSMTSAAWEHAFCLVLVVRLGTGWIELELQAANTGRSTYAFTAAIHTYLAVRDVRSASVLGLQGLSYEDNTQGNALHTDAAAALAVGGEVDRVYRAVPPALRLEGGGMPARRILQEGFTDTVVWNPGPDKATRLGDMPPGDWLRMLCIEAAVVAQPVPLAPGKTWRGMQRLELARS
ncbi:MAG TPA: D-hexose-6-phosphate mutarotase [Ramlibacter sp.]